MDFKVFMAGSTIDQLSCYAGGSGVLSFGISRNGESVAHEYSNNQKLEAILRYLEKDKSLAEWNLCILNNQYVLFDGRVQILNEEEGRVVLHGNNRSMSFTVKRRFSNTDDFVRVFNKDGEELGSGPTVQSICGAWLCRDCHVIGRSSAGEEGER